MFFSQSNPPRFCEIQSFWKIFFSFPPPHFSFSNIKNHTPVLCDLTLSHFTSLVISTEKKTLSQQLFLKKNLEQWQIAWQMTCSRSQTFLFNSVSYRITSSLTLPHPRAFIRLCQHCLAEHQVSGEITDPMWPPQPSEVQDEIGQE